MRDATLNQLGRFGFFLEGVKLHMFREKDWMSGGLGDARRRILAGILEGHRVMRVIDDFPRLLPCIRRARHSGEGRAAQF